MEKLKGVKFLIIHHTQRPNDTIDSLRDYHTKKRHFEDIGYHYVIGNSINTKDGKIYKTRLEKYKGAHAVQVNKNSLGIALIGNFDKAFPTEKQFNSLLKLLKELIKKYKIPTKKFIGHNKIKDVAKTCPGKNFDMTKLRKILASSKKFI